MSTFDNENIDRLFDSLEDHSMDAEFEQFGDMEIRLEKLRYFRFGWKHFNIYYTGIIGITFALSSYLFIDYLRTKPVENKVVVMTVDSTQQEENIVVEQAPAEVKAPVVRKAENTPAPQLSLSSLADSSITVKPVVIAPAPVKVDSLPKAPKPKRIVVIPRRDTIIKYDTTKVIKRK